VPPPIRSQFKKKLAERLENPRVPADKFSGYDSVYKIKLRAAGYRLAYEVIDDELFVYVIAVGKREKSKVYSSLKKRT
jgi:mRNA interferase RelE/StbE